MCLCTYYLFRKLNPTIIQWLDFKCCGDITNIEAIYFDGQMTL